MKYLIKNGKKQTIIAGGSLHLFNVYLKISNILLLFIINSIKNVYGMILIKKIMINGFEKTTNTK